MSKICKTCKAVFKKEDVVITRESRYVKTGGMIMLIPFKNHLCPNCGALLGFVEDGLEDLSRPTYNKMTNIEIPLPKPNPSKDFQDHLGYMIRSAMSKTLAERLDKEIEQELQGVRTKINADKRKKGYVIVIEGTDGSGKQTQSTLLHKYLTEKGVKAHLCSFPNYNSDQGKIVKRYLQGEFKGQHKDIEEEVYRNGFLYSNDRMVTCMEKDDTGRSILDKYNDGEVIIFDRYTQSNFIHQAGMLENDDFELFVDFFTSLEYKYMGLPEPDMVLYLSVLPEISMNNIEKRGEAKDSHENIDHLTKVYKNSQRAIEYCEWTEISCCERKNNEWVMSDKNKIHKIIEAYVDTILFPLYDKPEYVRCPDCEKKGLSHNMEDLNVENLDVELVKCTTCSKVFDKSKLEKLK